jgi:hypothetical protein
MLGYVGSVQDAGWSWEPDSMSPGQGLPEPEPLFTKLDEAVVEEETQRLGN